MAIDRPEKAIAKSIVASFEVRGIFHVHDSLLGIVKVSLAKPNRVKLSKLAGVKSDSRIEKLKSALEKWAVKTHKPELFKCKISIVHFRPESRTKSELHFKVEGERRLL